MSLTGLYISDVLMLLLVKVGVRYSHIVVRNCIVCISHIDSAYIVFEFMLLTMFVDTVLVNK